MELPAEGTDGAEGAEVAERAEGVLYWVSIQLLTEHQREQHKYRNQTLELQTTM